MGLSSLHDPTKAFPSSTGSDPPAPTPVLQKETKSDKEHYLVLSGWLVSGVITVALFMIDLLSPLGYAVCMLYAVPILLTRLTPDLQSTMIMAGATVSLTWAGAELSPGAIAQHDSSNRIMATALLLGITWILGTQKQSARQIKVAQEARYESEERLRLFIEHAPVALAMFDHDMRYLAVSRRWITDYGLSDRDVIGQSHYEILPEIPERWRAVHQRGLEGEIVREEEDLFQRADGTERWVCWEMRPWKTDEGHVGGIVIFTEDITERKMVEQELRNHQAQLEDLTAKLLTSQEEERKRIARDLHDDFTQQLAALTIDLQRQARLASESGTPPASHLVQMGKKTEQLTTDLQRMAHRLHSSLLEHVGLEAAFRECVDECSTRAGLTTELVMRELPRGISLEQATCLYRVLQESLQNVTKHAKAANILIRLQSTRSGLELYIQDDGLGFDQSENAAHSNGLGLTSMAERIKGLQGTFRIESTLGFGTEIHAWIPISEVERNR